MQDAEPAEGMTGVADVLVEISVRADFPSGVESVRCIGR
jgi:urease gamma subunit